MTLRISGFFRDAFPTQIDLFDSAVRAIMALDEAVNRMTTRWPPRIGPDAGADWLDQGIDADEAWLSAPGFGSSVPNRVPTAPACRP